MKTQKNKLAFAKNSIVELNDERLNEISGGSTIALGVSLFVATYIATEIITRQIN